MSFSQFYVLSPRGDTIIYRDFRHDVSKSTVEIFFRNCKFWMGKNNQEAPPVFNLDGINYLYLKKNGLYFVFTTRDNVSPALGIELLTRLTKLFKDYAGVLSEESIRTNFILIYELLDEVIDFGYPQLTNTESIKRFVFNTPIVTKTQTSSSSSSGPKLFDLNPKTTPSTSVDKPIAFAGSLAGSKGSAKQKNEIFVDIYERISITFNSNGLILNANIDGTIQMKSYLAGNPELRLALNEDLIVKGSSGSSSASRVPHYAAGVVEVDDVNFHECAKLGDFDTHRILSFQPPEGEFVLMNYRITGDTFRPPFRMYPFFELVSPYKVELIVKVRADIPDANYGGNVLLTIPMPKSTSSVVAELPVSVGAAGQSWEYDAKERRVLWKIKKFQGGTEQSIRCRVTLSTAASAAVRKEIGPLALNFEIPMYNPSGVQVRYLRILENKNYNPYRWVRYVTRSQSYVCRL